MSQDPSDFPSDSTPVSAHQFARKPAGPPLWHTVLALPVAMAGGWFAQWLHWPVPWLTGPLLAVGLCSLRGLPVRAPAAARMLGQLVIGLALGLQFTPEVLRSLTGHAPALLIATLFSLAQCLGAAMLLARWGGVDRGTAFFCGMVGGASEMAVAAERAGVRVDLVAAAHSLRVLIVVAVVPAVTQYGLGPGAQLSPMPVLGLRWAAGLALVGIGVSLLADRCRLPNAWVLAPMAVAAVPAATSGLHGDLPPAMVHGGQLLIGWALGQKFGPDFFRLAPRLLSVMAAVTLLLLCSSAALAWGLVQFENLSLGTALLATSPGGIAEMCSTAQALKLSVAEVTSFQVLRLTAVVMLAAPAARWFIGWRSRAA